MAEVRLDGVSRVFPGGAVAVSAIDLLAADGEFLVLVGPSGSGKSTLLRMVAGLDTPTAGRVWIGGEDVTALPPQRRNVAMVFQSYALYPHKTVRENLAFGLRARGAPAATIRERVATAAALLGIEPLLERRPAQLSGGQRQRVALGRAMVREPQAFLLDEPLSNLDPTLRAQTRTELARLQRRLGATVLHVTHDQEEAMTLGHRVAVMNEGRLQQVAPPMDLYREPANLFVAGFIGSPPMNLVPCALETEGEETRARGGSIVVPSVRPPKRARGRAVLGIRPHDVELGPSREGGGWFGGRVDLVEPLGSSLLLHVEPDRDGPGGGSGTAAGPGGAGSPEGAAGGEASAAPEASVGLGDGAQLRVVVPADRDVRRDEAVGLRFSPERLHWFDPETGTRLR